MNARLITVAISFIICVIIWEGGGFGVSHGSEWEGLVLWLNFIVFPISGIICLIASLTYLWKKFIGSRHGLSKNTREK